MYLFAGFHSMHSSTFWMAKIRVTDLPYLPTSIVKFSFLILNEFMYFLKGYAGNFSIKMQSSINHN